MSEQVECRGLAVNDDGSFDCEINHPAFGWIPFTASADDVELHGRQIWAAIREAVSAGAIAAASLPDGSVTS